jgi:hypothetical protein
VFITPPEGLGIHLGYAVGFPLVDPGQPRTRYQEYRHGRCQVGEPGRWGGAGSTIVIAAGSSYKGFRFSPEVIGHCVWLYHRFPLSFRDVQELMLQRGVDVCYETIRAWCERFGAAAGREPAVPSWSAAGRQLAPR